MTYEQVLEQIESGEIIASSLNWYGEEAVRMIIKAVEKQIPKKPIKPIDLHSSHQCPACGEVTLPGADYCDGCGQKLLWEERA